MVYYWCFIIDFLSRYEQDAVLGKSMLVASPMAA